MKKTTFDPLSSSYFQFMAFVTLNQFWTCRFLGYWYYPRLWMVNGPMYIISFNFSYLFLEAYSTICTSYLYYAWIIKLYRNDNRMYWLKFSSFPLFCISWFHKTLVCWVKLYILRALDQKANNRGGVFFKWFEMWLKR